MGDIQEGAGWWDTEPQPALVLELDHIPTEGI